LEEESIIMLGKTFAIVEARVDTSTKRIEIRLIGPDGIIKFVDNDYSDNAFSSAKSEVNGKSINGFANIQGFESANDIFRIERIRYRFFPQAKVGSDVYVPPRRGVQQYLREPEGMLTRSFDILYGGLGTAVKASMPAKPTGNKVMFDPKGDTQYNLVFINNLGQKYNIPIVNNKGVFKYGDESRDLIYIEGSSDADFNIDVGDWFVVTSNTDINGYTNIIRYNTVSGNTIAFDDLAGEHKEVSFDSDGNGNLAVLGTTYKFKVDSATNSIVVDQNGDGSFDSDEVRIIFFGGQRLDLGSSNSIGGSSVTMKYITPSRLFSEPSSDEEVSITVSTSGGEVDIDVPDQSAVSLIRDDVDSMDKGMTTFGNLFILNDQLEPSELDIYVPSGQIAGGVSIGSGGQAQGFVVITLEREKFVQKSQQAK